METTLTLQKETIEKVQELIETNLDSSKLMHEAATSTKDERLQSLFNSLAAARAGFAQELQSYVHLNGEHEESSGTALGSVRTNWLRFRAAINGKDAKVVLIEAERAEDSIKEAYEDVLKETAGSALNAVLTKQYARVKAGHDQVRDLRDSYLDS